MNLQEISTALRQRERARRRWPWWAWILVPVIWTFTTCFLVVAAPFTAAAAVAKGLRDSLEKDGEPS